MTSPGTPSSEELAGQPIDGADQRVLAAVAELYSVLDPVPERLVERIQFGITLDALHAEIAELERSGGLAGVRSGDEATAQTITFTTPSLTTMLTITVLSAERARIDGWLAPGGTATVTLRTASAAYEAAADDDGRFVFADVPRGLGQFVVRPAGGGDRPAVVSPSIEF